jgi:rhodanese-related sulfurtransferase
MRTLMPSFCEITTQQLTRIIGLPHAPHLVDVRDAETVGSDPRLLPTARRLNVADIEKWGPTFRGERVVVYCGDGGSCGRGVAAWLRDDGASAETLMGGFAGWVEARQPLVHPRHLPARDATGRTVWVTRARPKIVRVACPWLIRRFIDPGARFLFVAPAEVEAVARQFNATPFDTGHGLWNDRGLECTFDVMLGEFGLATEPLLRLAEIIRGADTDRLDLAPQCAGLLAASLGFSRMYRDDTAQIDAAMGIYDAFYRWCRDATDETHG